MLRPQSEGGCRTRGEEKQWGNPLAPRGFKGGSVLGWDCPNTTRPLAPKHERRRLAAPLSPLLPPRRQPAVPKLGPAWLDDEGLFKNPSDSSVCLA